MRGDKEPSPVSNFHASYRQEHPVTKGRSYTIIDGIRGKGQFLGVTLAAGMNGNNTCWVEGEAKMYIDDDRYPSINYTGTEDYFTGSYGFGNDKGDRGRFFVSFLEGEGDGSPSPLRAGSGKYQCSIRS